MHNQCVQKADIYKEPKCCILNWDLGSSNAVPGATKGGLMEEATRGVSGVARTRGHQDNKKESAGIEDRPATVRG